MSLATANLSYAVAPYLQAAHPSIPHALRLRIPMQVHAWLHTQYPKARVRDPRLCPPRGLCCSAALSRHHFCQLPSFSPALMWFANTTHRRTLPSCAAFVQQRLNSLEPGCYTTISRVVAHLALVTLAFYFRISATFANPLSAAARHSLRTWIRCPPQPLPIESNHPSSKRGSSTLPSPSLLNTTTSEINIKTYSKTFPTSMACGSC